MWVYLIHIGGWTTAAQWATDERRIHAVAPNGVHLVCKKRPVGDHDSPAAFEIGRQHRHGRRPAAVVLRRRFLWRKHPGFQHHLWLLWSKLLWQHRLPVLVRKFNAPLYTEMVIFTRENFCCVLQVLRVWLRRTASQWHQLDAGHRACVWVQFDFHNDDLLLLPVDLLSEVVSLSNPNISNLLYSVNCGTRSVWYISMSAWHFTNCDMCSRYSFNTVESYISMLYIWAKTCDLLW